MAMNISSNYGECYGNTFSAQNKESTRSSEVRSNTLENSKDSVDAYYEKLCKKFPQISISIMNVDKVSGLGDIKLGNENNMVLNLSKNCLKKMACDSAFAEKIEDIIAGIPEGHKWLYAQAKSDGRTLFGNAVIINADGSAQGAIGGSTSSGNTNKSVSMLNVKNGTKDKLDKLREKNLEKRKEEAERIEKVQKEKKEKEDYMERLLDKYSSAVNTYDATGYEIENVTSTVNRQV